MQCGGYAEDQSKECDGAKCFLRWKDVHGVEYTVASLVGTLLYPMRLRAIILEQFRSYSQAFLEFSDANVHLLVGENGAGKTNILEAMSLLSVTKSLQGIEENDLIQWDAEYYRVTGSLLSDDAEEKKLEVVYQIAPRKQKACFVNDVKTSIGDMVGLLPTVTFLPQDLQLFSGPPALRRSFIDQLLCQVSAEYLRTLSTYQKVLKQRNSLLRSIVEGTAQRSHLELWNHELAHHGSIVTMRRVEMMHVLQCTLEEELHRLGEKWEQVLLVYERKGEAHTAEEAEGEMEQLLLQATERDLILQSTTVGPHREDWRLDIAGHSVPTFASRGQQRTAVLALLFLEVSYIELQRTEKPVILLDDVFSELDDAHQQALLSSLQEHQVFITATHLPEGIGTATVYDVERGTVKVREEGLVGV